MKRFVTYIYEYDGGARGRNVGFVRTDIRNDGCRMDLHIRGLNCSKAKATIYFVIANAPVIGIPVAEMIISQGVGQAKLMMVYQKLFAEYNETAGQVLLTKNTMINPVSRENAKNTFEELFQLGVIPIVNENDTTSTYEMQFGDNDTLSALVSSMVGADLLILLSDIDGLYTDDPHTNPDAKLVQVVENLDEEILGMAKGTTGSNVGTGGMTTKLTAAKIATLSGTDMIIANGADVKILAQIFEDAYTGTLFKSNKNANFNLATYVMETIG